MFRKIAKSRREKCLSIRTGEDGETFETLTKDLPWAHDIRCAADVPALLAETQAVGNGLLQRTHCRLLSLPFKKSVESGLAVGWLRFRA